MKREVTRAKNPILRFFELTRTANSGGKKTLGNQEVFKTSCERKRVIDALFLLTIVDGKGSRIRGALSSNDYFLRMVVDTAVGKMIVIVTLPAAMSERDDRVLFVYRQTRCLSSFRCPFS